MTKHDPNCAVIRAGNLRAYCDCEKGRLVEALEDLWTWVDLYQPSELVDHPEWDETNQRVKKALGWSHD